MSNGNGTLESIEMYGLCASFKFNEKTGEWEDCSYEDDPIRAAIDAEIMRQINASARSVPATRNEQSE